jgi:hypothetical protein
VTASGLAEAPITATTLGEKSVIDPKVVWISI